jgi:hypothetical protein
MIKTTIQLNFHGEKYIRNLSGEINDAINRGAMLVQRETKELLNKTGKSIPAKAGLNSAKTVQGRKNAPSEKSMNLAAMKAQRLYWYGEPLHRWVEASQPGSPPHKQTGTLQRSISIQPSKRSSKKMTAKIGPAQQLKYARVHEMGSDKMPMRPYLTPAFMACEPKIMQYLANAIRNAKP